MATPAHGPIGAADEDDDVADWLRREADRLGLTEAGFLRRYYVEAERTRAEALADATSPDPIRRLNLELIRAKAALPDEDAATRGVLLALLGFVQSVADPLNAHDHDALIARLVCGRDDRARNPAGGAASPHAVMRVRALAVAAVERLAACRMPREQARQEIARAFAGLEPPPGRKPRPEVTPNDLRDWHRSLVRRDDKAASPRELELYGDARELFAGEPPAAVPGRLRPLLEGLLPRPKR